MNAKRDMGWGLGCALAVSVLAAGAALARGGGDDGADARIGGIVTAVGASTAPTTLTISGAAGTLVLNITLDTELELNDRDNEADDDRNGDGEDDREASAEAAIAADLRTLVGRFAEVEYNPASRNVEEIEVETEFEVTGTVESVGGSSIPNSVTIRPAVGPVVVVQATAETQIELNDLQIRDLRQLVGQVVDVDYDPDTGVAGEIEVDPRNARFQGALTSVDAAGGILTVRNSAGTVASFVVPDNADVDLDNQDSSVQELAAGMVVNIRYRRNSAGQNVARNVEAFTVQAAAAQGTVASVLPRASSLVLNIAGRPVRVKVNSLSLVTLNGRRVPLRSVPRGAAVQVSAVSRRGLVIARQLVARTR